MLGGIPLPWGIVVDGATGAWWKPDVKEAGVSKDDFNNFVYTIDYDGCEDPIITEGEALPHSSEENVRTID